MDSGTIIKDGRLALATRIFLLLILPFLLGAWVFPHIAYVEGTQSTAPSEDQPASAGLLAYAFNHSEETIEPALTSLFPLASYLNFPPLVSNSMQLCFSDNGSGVILSNGTRIAPDFQWVISINNRSNVVLDSNSEACGDINSNGKNSFVWNANIGTGLNPEDLNGTLTFDPQTSSHPRQVVDYGMLQGLIMIPIFYLLVWYPAFGIWKKIEHGMHAQ